MVFSMFCEELHNYAIVSYLTSYCDVDINDYCLLPDVKKMPLGKLSKSQIAKGFEVRLSIPLRGDDRYYESQLFLLIY